MDLKVFVVFSLFLSVFLLKTKKNNRRFTFFFCISLLNKHKNWLKIPVTEQVFFSVVRLWARYMLWVVLISPISGFTGSMGIQHQGHFAGINTSFRDFNFGFKGQGQKNFIRYDSYSGLILYEARLRPDFSRPHSRSRSDSRLESECRSKFKFRPRSNSRSRSGPDFRSRPDRVKFLIAPNSGLNSRSE